MEQECVTCPRVRCHREAEKSPQTRPSGVAYALGRGIFLVCWGLNFGEAAWRRACLNVPRVT